MLTLILKFKVILSWLKKNIAVIIPSVLLVGMILFHFFETYNPPITQPVIISPMTREITLDNGQKAQEKVSTPSTENPEQAGFSKEFINDTINKILGVKNKEILGINRITGKYKDSLNYVREELDEKQRTIKYFESKDSKGRIIGTGKTVDGGGMAYSADVDMTTVRKKAKDKKSLDSIIFYDPDQRFTIKGSKEFSVAIPKETVTRRWTFSVNVGAGIVIPSFDTKRATLGGYVGGGVSYNFR